MPDLHACLHNHRRVLALDLEALTPASCAAPLALLHLAGVLISARLAHWSAGVALLILIAAAAGAITRHPADGKRRLQPALALPLVVLYAFVLIRLALTLLFRLRGLDGLPPAWGQALPYEGALAVAVAWLGAIQVARHVPEAHWKALAAQGLLWGSVGWALFMFPQLAPAGVTGTDPYAYVQMAADLSQHGTLLHRFPLVEIPADLGLSVTPAMQIGYNAEFLTADWYAPTVWPVGYSVLLAGAGLLGGVDAMLAVNGVLAALSLLAAYWLTVTILPGRRVIGLLAAAFLLTSVAQMANQSAPFADIAAGLFTTLALLLVVISTRDDGEALGWAALAGLCFGGAYAMRYTQVLVAPAFLFLFWRRWRAAFVFGAAAAAVATPDLLYHAAVHGSPFNAGTNQWGLFSVATLPTATLRVLKSWLVDWSLAAPLVVLGTLTLVRENKRVAVALALGLGTATIFHLLYTQVLLRDLLWWWPTLAMLAALGVWSLRRWRGAALLAVLLALGLRWGVQARTLVDYESYGRLTEEQRASIERIADLTPPDAVIAASLNSGPLELYAGRRTLRPGALFQPTVAWGRDGWLRVAADVQARGYPLYVLVDSDEMVEPLAAVQEEFTVEPVATLPLPYFLDGGGMQARQVTLYRVAGP